jgi:hypothetical protein
MRGIIFERSAKMTLPKLGLMAVSATLILGLVGPAEARNVRREKAVQARYSVQQPVRFRSYEGIGMYRVSPGDSVAAIRAGYPVDPNPPNLRQYYDLRGRMMQEFRN